MIIEKLKNGVFTSECDGELILTITDLGNHTYRAINKFLDITAEVIPLGNNKAQLKSIENKITDKAGRSRKSKKLLHHNLNWLWYMLQEKGFEGFNKKSTL